MNLLAWLFDRLPTTTPVPRLPPRPQHPSVGRVRDAAVELNRLADEWEREWDEMRENYETICAEENLCVIRRLQGCGIDIEGYTVDRCQHRDGTRSVYDDGGRILFRCLRCGAGRDREGRWVGPPQGNPSCPA